MNLSQEEILGMLADGPEAWNAWINDNYRIGTDISATIKDHSFGDFSFTGYDLPISLTFIHCIFLNHSPFEGIEKVGELVFINCGNLPHLAFEDASEVGAIHIRDCESAQSLSIYQARVFGTIHLIDLRIYGSLNIQGCNMKKEGTSTPNVFLHNITVDDDACFDKLEIDLYFQCLNCKFNSALSAKRAIFGHRATFTNCTFSDHTDFSETIFKRPPYFDGAELHPMTIFPPEENFHITRKDKNDDIRKDVEAIRLLKVQASTLLNRRMQGMFFSLEQKYLRASGDMSTSDALLSYIYEQVSDYGRSVTKPLKWLSFSTIIFAIIYALIKSPALGLSLRPDFDIIEEGIRLSFQSTFLPFRSILSENESIWTIILSVLQSLFSLSCFALFGFAVRWLFKRD